MNITFTPSFKAKNKELRKADDIVRNAKKHFPATSPTYIDSFYKTNKSPDIRTEIKAKRVIVKTDNKISQIRDNVKTHSFEGFTQEQRMLNAPIFNMLRGIKALRVANCHENAAIAMAALAANGIYDGERANLELIIKYKNKKTGEIEYEKNIPLDHTVVLTHMNKKSKEKIVVDAWLGFADSMSSSSEKFKKLLIDEEVKKAISVHRSLFRLEKFEQEGRLVDIDEEYELKQSINYKIAEKSDIAAMIAIGNMTNIIYPELRL